MCRTRERVVNRSILHRGRCGMPRRFRQSPPRSTGQKSGLDRRRTAMQEFFEVPRALTGVPRHALCSEELSDLCH